MAHSLRHTICSKIFDIIKTDNALNGPNRLISAIELKILDNKPEYHLPIVSLQKIFSYQLPNSVISDIVTGNFGASISKCFEYNEENSAKKTNKLIFKLHKDAFISDTLLQSTNPVDAESQKILVEFSSPNIAKPFHVGHLRSTIIGNFISNLYESLQHNVVRINYLGDWGTQFGFLKVGMDLANLTDEEVKLNPITHLYNAYVYANKLSEQDENIARQARDIFCQLENSKYSDIEKWKKYREYTIDELKSVYSRIGVTFNEYEWESQYSKQNIQNLLSLMERNNMISIEPDGKQVVTIKDKKVPVIKSDGTTLYLIRDIAALVERYKVHKFDKLLYIVDNAQHAHFDSLFDIGGRLKQYSIGSAQHIKFGRIHGMSTRKGNTIFLKDVFDEAKNIMLQKQIQSTTTKTDVSRSDERIDDILGISAVIVNDLKQRRTRDYNFVWNNALQMNGDTGIKLQYTHCRLCSLEENVNIQAAQICVPDLLREREAEQLIFEIARYPDIIFRCKDSLEACILVNYLFSLSNAVSRALKVLTVKNHSNLQVQEQRMLLFTTSRKILNKGMRILGLQPLKEM